MTKDRTARVLRLVNLPDDVWAELVRWSRGDSWGSTFRRVVGRTRFTSTRRVALVVVRESVVGGVVVRRWGRPGRGQDGLEFVKAEAFQSGMPLSQLRDGLPSSRRRFLSRTDGEAVPSATSRELESGLERLAPGSRSVLDRLFLSVTPIDRGTGTGALVREQRDAVALALEIAGFDSRQELGAVATLDQDVPFLTGYARTRTSEASILRHDARVFDGWFPTEARHLDVVSFQDPASRARRMTVFYADKEKLELQTGTDLIYYRHQHPGFILVQYKRMRMPTSGSGTPVYYPDDQLRTELERMKSLPTSAPPSSPDEWRLTEDAFFVKLVAEDMARPIANRLVRGRYLPSGLVQLLLEAAERRDRPRGWSADNLTTYLSNEEFLQLAKQGYLGTRGATTEHIEGLIKGAFEADRGVIVAVNETEPQSVPRPRHG